MTYHSVSPWLGGISSPIPPSLITAAEVGDGQLYHFPQEGYGPEGFARLNWGIQKVGLYLEGEMTLVPDSSATMRNIVTVSFEVAPDQTPPYPPDPESPASEFTDDAWPTGIIQGWTITQSATIGGEIFTFDLGWQPVYVSFEVIQIVFNPWDKFIINDGVPTFYGAFRLRLNASWQFDGIVGSGGTPLLFPSFDTYWNPFASGSFDIEMPADFNEPTVPCFPSSTGDVSECYITSAMFEVGQMRGNVTPL